MMAEAPSRWPPGLPHERRVRAAFVLYGAPWMRHGAAQGGDGSSGARHAPADAGAQWRRAKTRHSLAASTMHGLRHHDLPHT